MRTLKNKQHGTEEFPCGYYSIDKDCPTFHMPLHWHTEFEIILVRTGRFHLTLNGVPHRLYAGDMAFIGGGVLHGGSPEGDDCVYDCVVFDLSLLSRSIENSIITGLLHDHKMITPILSFTDSQEIWETVVHLMDAFKNRKADARRSEGQFCKNTVYFARDMPYSCFFRSYAVLRISSINSSNSFSSGMSINPTAVK